MAIIEVENRNTALINKLLEVLVYIAFGKISKTVDRGKYSSFFDKF